MRVLAQGEQGIVVELGDAIDPAVNARVHALARAIAGRLGSEILEVVPAYRSLLVLHDPFRSPRARLVRRIERLAALVDAAPAPGPRRVVRLPVCYGGEFGPDLGDVARHAGLEPAEVISIHADPVYRVYMLGFTPGFPYLGGMSPRLACPRLEVPRTRIPAGSVAIGGAQTGVYPVESPGGWRLVGRTPARLFDPGSRTPFLLAAGDGLRFVPVAREAFEALAGEVERGTSASTSVPDIESSAPAPEPSVPRSELSMPDIGTLALAAGAAGAAGAAAGAGHRAAGAGHSAAGAGAAGAGHTAGTAGAGYRAGRRTTEPRGEGKLTISVLKPGLYTTVQDGGRPGLRAFGMPVAGAIDPFAHAVANLLAGNEPSAAAVEFTLVGGIFRFERDAHAALAGADMQARLDGEPIAPWSSFRAPAGSTLALGAAAAGVRCYLAVRGGIDVPVILGSRSTYVRARVGGHMGRRLEAEDALPVGRARGRPPPPRALPPGAVPACGGNVLLRAVPGPQDDRFHPQGIETFYGAAWAVSPHNDRMGYRLDGPPVRHLEGADIVTDPLLPGAVQVPGNGLPIVLMVDCQTAGGYAKIATVIGPDLRRLAQARAGDRVRFARVTHAAALRAAREERAGLETLARRIGRGGR